MNHLPFAHPVHAAGRRAAPAVRQQAERERHPLDRERRRVRRLRHLRPALVLVQPAECRVPVRRAAAVDSVDRRGLLPRRRRLQHAADPADDDDGVHRGAVVVDGDHRAGEGVRHLPARPADRHARRVHVARLPAVLPVLGSDAGADVLPHRHLGQRQPALLGDQVLPLHPGRQRRHAAGHPGALLPHAGHGDGAAHVRRHPVPAAEPAVRPAVVGLPGVLPRLRDQGADVPVPHLAARRAHRRADGRLGDSGGRPPEDGHLRVHPLQPADSARGDAHLRADDRRRCRSSASSTARSSRSRRRTGSGWSPTRRSATWRW